jgi:hypothetical protein
MNDDDPWPLRSGVCDRHGGFNNFSGRCLGCERDSDRGYIGKPAKER